MTRDRDIERVLDKWLAEGATQMPDRLFDAVIDRIDRVPQRRLARIQTRLLAMNFNVRLAAAAAIVVAVVGISILSLSPRQNIGTTPSPTPSASQSSSPSPSAPAAALPAELQHRWNGPTRSVAGMEPPATSAAVILTGRLMRFDGGGAPRPELGSSASFVAPDHLRLSIVTPAAGCSAGAIGTYKFTLSPGGGYLTLTPEGDACAARSQAISGDWVRSECPDQGRVCLGDLEGGPHVSAVFTPFVPFDDWTYDYGRFGYTVPAGWANIEEDRALYVIARQGAGEDASIWLLSEVAAHSQGTDCPENTPAAGVGRTQAALADWIRTVPGLNVTAAQPVVVGGLNGVTLDVSVDPAWTRVCPGETEPTVELFADAHGDEHDVKVHGDVPMRIFLLDLGDGRTLLTFIYAVDKPTYDALVSEAMPIIDSFEFRH